MIERPKRARMGALSGRRPARSTRNVMIGALVAGIIVVAGVFLYLAQTEESRIAPVARFQFVDANGQPVANITYRYGSSAGNLTEPSWTVATQVGGSVLVVPDLAIGTHYYFEFVKPNYYLEYGYFRDTTATHGPENDYGTVVLNRISSGASLSIAHSNGTAIAPPHLDGGDVVPLQDDVLLGATWKNESGWTEWEADVRDLDVGGDVAGYSALSQVNFSSLLGGTSSDGAYAAVTDDDGNMYITGGAGSGFPTKDAHQGSFAGGTTDAFVSRFNSTGDLAFSTYLGGSMDDVGYGITVGPGGNVYVVGFTYSNDFPTQSAYDGVRSGTTDGFISKLSPTGSLLYSTYFGGSGDEQARGIAVGDQGYIYVTGDTSSGDFPTQNAYDSSKWGTWDAFVTKFAVDGQSLVYSTYIGGSSTDRGYGIDINVDGFAFITGETWASDYPLVNAYDTSRASAEAFVTKFVPNGTQLAFSTFIGGDAHDLGRGIAARPDGGCVAVGNTQSSNFPICNAYDDTYAWLGWYDPDGFVASFNASGNATFVTYLGGSYDDKCEGVSVSRSGRVFVSGWTESSDFPTTDPVMGDMPNHDAIVAVFNETGGAIMSTYFGGDGSDYGSGISVNRYGNVSFCGYTNDSTNFPLQDAYQSSHGGGASDAFVARNMLDVLLDGSGSADVYVAFGSPEGRERITNATVGLNYSTVLADAWESSGVSFWDADADQWSSLGSLVDTSGSYQVSEWVVNRSAFNGSDVMLLRIEITFTTVEAVLDIAHLTVNLEGGCLVVSYDVKVTVTNDDPDGVLFDPILASVAPWIGDGYHGFVVFEVHDNTGTPVHLVNDSVEPFHDAVVAYSATKFVISVPSVVDQGTIRVIVNVPLGGNVSAYLVPVGQMIPSDEALTSVDVLEEW